MGNVASINTQYPIDSDLTIDYVNQWMSCIIDVVFNEIDEHEMGNGASINKQNLDNDFVFGIIDDLLHEIDEQEVRKDTNEELCPDFVIPITSTKDLYSYQAKIGKGISGNVFLVQHKRTHKRYALKELCRNDLNYKSFMNEINILKQIDHPNIIRLNDAFISEEHFLLATEYCAKGTLLHQLMVKKRFSEKKASEFVKKILEAVAYIHSNNIVHRDLKLSNIVLDRHSQLKLIDFGQSEKITDYDAVERMIYGSLYYLCPETTTRRTKRDLFGGDMWSIGIISYMLVQGVIPFAGSSIESLVQSIHESELKYTVSVSDLCKDFIESLLNKDVTKRLSAEEALRHPWITGVNHNDSVCVDALAPKLIQCTSELQGIMVDAILRKMDEIDRNVLFSMKYLNDEQLINCMISSNGEYEETSLSAVDVNTLDIDDILAEIDSETEHRSVSSSQSCDTILDGISIKRFIHILECSTRKYNIPQIVCNIMEEGSHVISFKRIASYNIPIQEV